MMTAGLAEALRGLQPPQLDEVLIQLKGGVPMPPSGAPCLQREGYSSRIVSARPAVTLKLSLGGRKLEESIKDTFLGA